MAFNIILGRDDLDKKKFGTEASIFLGKHYVKMGQTTSLSQPIFLDVNKAHVVFVCGKRGTGKCVTGETLITLANGEVIPIKELEQKDEKVLSLNHDLKINSANKEGFYKRNVDKVIKITLRSGKEITLTPEHPLLTINGWIPAGKLPINSRIATPRIIPNFGKQLLPENEIKILAYMIAEGHTKLPLFFTNKDELIVKDLENALKDFADYLELTPLGNFGYKINSRNEKRKCGGYKGERDQKGRFMKGGQIIFEKRKIRLFFEKHKVYGKIAKEKNIPKEIFTLPKRELSLFLNRLFSCDGSIYNFNSWEISYSSSSEELIKQVQHLLLRFEILSRLRQKNIKLNDKIFKSYELVINGINVEKYIQEIGFFGYKNKIQQKALDEIESIIRNPNVDTIPKELWDFYRPGSWVSAGKALGYDSPKSARSSVNYSSSRQKLLTIAKQENNERMIKLAQSDIFWDEIIRIEEKIGKIEVYDITVPELHNFIANDIIIHNSYSLGVIAEGITSLPENIRNRLSVLIFDTMGVYWTMKYPNHADEKLLKEWDLTGEGMDVDIHTPIGFFKKFKEEGVPVDFPFALNPAELNPEDWNLTFMLEQNDPIAVFIERIILTLKEKSNNFDIEDILQEIRTTKFNEETKLAAENRFLSVNNWGLFSSKASNVKDILKSGKISVIDLSAYAMMPNGWRIKQLVTGLVCNNIFRQRMRVRKEEEFKSISKATHFISDEEPIKNDVPLVWVLIDEAHEFLPFEGFTASTTALKTLLREGRQPGISLVLATQQPGKIHTDAMTQSDVILAHRLTAKIDTDALGSLMQSYLRAGLDKEINILPKVPGACIAVDDVNERLYPMRVRPRFSWHGGSAPSVLEEKKKKLI